MSGGKPAARAACATLKLKAVPPCPTSNSKPLRHKDLSVYNEEMTGEGESDCRVAPLAGSNNRWRDSSIDDDVVRRRTVNVRDDVTSSQWSQLLLERPAVRLAPHPIEDRFPSSLGHLYNQHQTRMCQKRRDRQMITAAREQDALQQRAELLPPFRPRYHDCAQRFCKPQQPCVSPCWCGCGSQL